MNKQSGMTLLEVLLAMSIFTAVALTLMSSMQGNELPSSGCVMRRWHCG